MLGSDAEVITDDLCQRIRANALAQVPAPARRAKQVRLVDFHRVLLSKAPLWSLHKEIARQCDHVDLHLHEVYAHHANDIRQPVGVLWITVIDADQ